MTKNPVATAITCSATVVGIPDHDKATATEASDHRAILSTAGFGVNLEFATDSRPRSIVALGKHTRTTAVLTSIGGPGNDKPAITQRADFRLILLPDGLGIGLEFRPDTLARGVETLCEDAIAVAVLTGRCPHQHVAAIRQGGRGWSVLICAGEHIHWPFIQQIRRWLIRRRRGILEALQEDTGGAAIPSSTA